MDIVFQLFVNGLIAGGIYALFAVGLTMLYGILHFINFAHGELIMFGAFFVYVFTTKPFHLPLVLGILLSIVLIAFVGLGLDCAFKPLRRTGKLTLLIASIGLAFFLRNLAHTIWGAQLRTYNLPLQRGMWIGGVVITPNQIAIILTAFIAMCLLYVLLKKTKIGKAMRASADNLDLADISGIDVDRVISMVWVIGAIFAGIGGILLALDTNLHPEMGAINLIKGFAAAILGGVGNIPGAILGGFFVGLIENFGIWFMNPGYKDAIAFGIIIVVLLTRVSKQYLLRET
jgi:branched-chain amino acid transport system permease protein